MNRFYCVLFHIGLLVPIATVKALTFEEMRQACYDPPDSADGQTQIETAAITSNCLNQVDAMERGDIPPPALPFNKKPRMFEHTLKLPKNSKYE